MNISCPGSWELPEHMAGLAEPRKDPGRYRLGCDNRKLI